MRLLFYFVAICSVASFKSGGQGLVALANVGGGVNARVTYPNGDPVGPEFRAQRYAGSKGSPRGSLVPQLPIASFRSIPPESWGYINTAAVVLQNLPAWTETDVMIRAFNGPTWEESTYRGESEIITVIPFGDQPANLIGLEPFSVTPIPEPSVIALSGCAVVIFGFRRYLQPAGKARRSLRSSSATAPGLAYFDYTDWGHYSYTTVDPDDGTFWTIQQYAEKNPSEPALGTERYGTSIGNLR